MSIRLRTVSHLLLLLRIARYSDHGNVSFSTSLGAPCLTCVFKASSAFAPEDLALLDFGRVKFRDFTWRALIHLRDELMGTGLANICKTLRSVMVVVGR